MDYRFRDPWSNFVQNKFLNKLESTKIKHENKENLVLKFSDVVLTTSKSLNNEFKKKTIILFIHQVVLKIL